MATIPTSAPIPLAPAGAPAGGSYWFTTGDPGPARPAPGATRGGRRHRRAGFTGLWAAIRLLDTDPSLRVTVLEADRVGAGASGRNGGFCAASLTHGLGNGLLHFPHEIDVLEAEGRRNLAELVAFVRDEGIDCELEPTGVLDVATRRGRSPSSRSGSTCRRGTAPSSSTWTGTPCRPRSTRRASWPACGRAATAP